MLLDRIGVGPGWACLDLGCGVGGITDLLSRRVRPTGSVVGLDIDAEILAAARAWAKEEGLGNVEFVQGDAARSGLPRAGFDLVHVRFLFTTVGWREEVLQEALALVRPGGVLAVQEGDADFLRCHPLHPAWDRLKRALIPFARYLPETIRSVRRLILEQGLMTAAELDAALAECREHLAHPDALTTSVLLLQVWGHKSVA